MESTPGADVQAPGPALPLPMTWLDYAAAPPTPAPSRGGGRASGRLSAARAWDESPVLSLALPGDREPAAAPAPAGRPAEEAADDAGPAAKRSHWDVPAGGASRGAAAAFPPPSPAAGAGHGLWGAEPPSPCPSRATSAGLAAWPEFPDAAAGPAPR